MSIQLSTLFKAALNWSRQKNTIFYYPQPLWPLPLFRSRPSTFPRRMLRAIRASIHLRNDNFAKFSQSRRFANTADRQLLTSQAEKLASKKLQLAELRSLLTENDLIKGVTKQTYREIWRIYNCLMETTDPSSRLTIEDFTTLLRIVERYKSTSQRLDKWNQIINLVKDIKRARLKPTLEHYNAVMTAYSKVGNLEAVENAFLEAAEIKNPPDLEIYYRLLDAYITCDRLEDARNLLDRCKRLDMLQARKRGSVDMYYRMIHAYLKRNDLLAGIALLEQMRKESDIVPNIKIAATIFRSYVYMMKQMAVPGTRMYWTVTADVMPDIQAINEALARFVEHVKLEKLASTFSSPTLLSPLSYLETSFLALHSDLFTTSRLHTFYTTFRDCTILPSFHNTHVSPFVPFIPDVTTYNLLLDAYIAVNDVTSTHRTLREMASAGIHPTSHTLNIIIQKLSSNMSLSQLDRLYCGLVDSAASVASAPSSASFAPSHLVALMNDITFSTFIRAFASHGSTAFVSRIFVDMCSFRKWNEVVRCFEDMVQKDKITGKRAVEPNKTCYDALVTALFEMRDWSGCQTVLQEMAQEGSEEMLKRRTVRNVKPDVRTVDKVMMSMLASGETQKKAGEGDSVIRAFELVRRYSVDKKQEDVWVKMYNRLIYRLAKAKRMRTARLVYERMRKGHGDETFATPKPDLTTYNVMITSAVVYKNIKLARKVYADLLADSSSRLPSPTNISTLSSSDFDCNSAHPLRPNIITFNALLNGYATVSSHNYRKAALTLSSFQNLLREMSEHSVDPNIVTLNTLVKGLAKIGHMALARKFIDSMRDRGIEPDTVTINTLLGGYIRRRFWRRAEELLGQVREGKVKAELNDVTLNVLLKELLRVQGKGRNESRTKWERMNWKQKIRWREAKGLDRREVWKVYKLVMEASKVELGKVEDMKINRESTCVQGETESVDDSLRNQPSSPASISSYLFFPYKHTVTSATNSSLSSCANGHSMIRPNKNTFKLFAKAFLARWAKLSASKVIKDMRAWQKKNMKN
ncbi:hypothetical protein BC937DRAFT_88452 [Endogone sp. FLAS-F59071]|nr:hypothetical protein BC937DRAFT_88452 [Endogone sp. FLAS-F59071]|eukprot:RUS18696.1 hypothetical protein BC937DRAFT_88452 [Endogone sp. FLAS-F59071]